MTRDRGALLVFVTVLGLLALGLYMFHRARAADEVPIHPRQQADAQPGSNDLKSPIEPASRRGPTGESAVANTAVIWGRIGSDGSANVECVQRDGRLHADVVDDGGTFRFVVDAPNRCWLWAGSGGQRSGEKVIDVERNGEYEVKLVLKREKRIDVDVVGVPARTLQLPPHTRIVALDREVPVGQSLHVVEAGISAPFGIGRFYPTKIEQTQNGVSRVGWLEIHQEGPAWAYLCVGTHIIDVAPVPAEASNEVRLEWTGVEEVLGKLVVALPEPGQSGRCNVVGSGGRLEQQAFMNGVAVFEGLPRGNYLVEVEASGLGFAVMYASLAEDLVRLTPFLAGEPAHIQVRCVELGSGRPLSFAGESAQQRSSRHYVEMRPLVSASNDTAIRTSTLRHTRFGKRGELTLDVAPGRYLIRLRGPTFGSEFEPADAGAGDAIVTLGCEPWSHMVLVPARDQRWGGHSLQIRDANAQLVHERFLSRSRPETVRLLSGTCTARVFDGTGELCGEVTLLPLQGSKVFELWCNH